MKVFTNPVPNYQDISIFRECFFISLLCMTQLLTQAAVSQTVNNSEYVARTFGVQDKPGEISWFTASYSLTVGTFILIFGRLGDMHGYKLMFVLGYLWFGIFSSATGFAGFSSSTILFDIMRALQGIGPAILMPNSVALIGSYYPPGFRKNLCMCLFGSVAPTGFILGAFFNGIFAQLVWWPWTFWVCGMVCFVIAVAGFFVIPKGVGILAKGSFDYFGSAAGVTGLILFNFAWNQGPVAGWERPYVYVLMIVGLISIALFFYIEKSVIDPLVPRSVLKGETGAVLGCIAAGWSCFGIWLFYMYRWSLVIDGDTPILAATKNLPCIIPGFLAAISAAFLVQRFPTSFVLFLSMLAFFVGIVLMGTRPVGQIFWAQKFVSLLIQPIGMDMSFPAACIILSSALPPAQQGIAASLVATVVNYSISIGLGFAGTVEYYKTKDMSPSFETTVHGIRVAFYMGFGLAGLGVLVSALFMFQQIINKKKRSPSADEEKSTRAPSV
ncbi:multidrug-resistance type transporter [Scheffersomyces stipitis CBS 6054]|uniref:Multidrug-resistance type transporter n=1 Tax=Scheffersomyces stipitis (strain ATCC 58785 / CBS 6054 / NBRC 10063 / NRRL Y-11545) TaxID=322104 RepID=A3LPJ6_PICST|nr:multidrug-resistance type transporter [Scheffersomyces stipitis CBS 6054]ABN64506.2 multidrug-resistance type transporter [Scheffersomyces stipitis CBS 6054]KAG2736838.1 hypothetical protein G9P44_000928 [Scheffersomyces stipitis]